ncbi:hypothetical protein D9M69_693080 [compost metagenome]
MVDACRQGEQHLQVRQQCLEIVRRLPGRQVANVTRVAELRPGAPFDIRGLFGEQRLPLFAAHRVGFVEQCHGHFLI